MPFSLAGQLAQRAPVVQADSPLGLVAENLRASQGGVIAVLDRVTPDASQNAERGARIVGIVSQDDLSRASERVFTRMPEAVALNGHGSLDGSAVYTNGNGNGHAPMPEPSPLDTLASLKARDVMRADVPFVPAGFSLANALLTFDRAGLGALPVLDNDNRYLGILSRADVLSALAGNIRPPTVGGMATPLGVWLTDGVLEGGAPKIGLFLSGATISAYLGFSQIVLYFIARALNPSWGAPALSGRLGVASTESGLLNLGFVLVQSLILLLCFRLTPLSGIHAAEHQTVHALERGLPLTIENVRKMPRAHPRCGTNLMVMIGLFLIVVTHLPSLQPEWIAVGWAVVFFTWRSVGDVIQTVFTTRPATDKQIQSGINAANEVMRAYQAQPFLVSRSPLRVLNRGMVFALAGGFVTANIVQMLLTYMATHLT